MGGSVAGRGRSYLERMEWRGKTVATDPVSLLAESLYQQSLSFRRPIASLVDATWSSILVSVAGPGGCQQLLARVRDRQVPTSRFSNANVFSTRHFREPASCVAARGTQ